MKLGLDPAVNAIRLQVLPDRFVEVQVELKSLGTQRREQAAQRVLHLAERALELAEQDGLVASSGFRSDALELQLGRRQELKGFVVQHAGEAPAAPSAP